MNNEKKLTYIKKVLDLAGEEESKKHGYYKVLKFGQFKFYWDSWNGQFYLENKSGFLNINDYTEIIFKELLKTYRLPSTIDIKQSDITNLIDYLYIKDENIKKYFDEKVGRNE